MLPALSRTSITRPSRTTTSVPVESVSVVSTELRRKEDNLVPSARPIHAIERTPPSLDVDLSFPPHVAHDQTRRLAGSDEPDRGAAAIGLAENSAVDLERSRRVTAKRACHPEVAAVDGRGCAVPCRQRAQRLESDGVIVRMHNLESRSRRIKPEQVDIPSSSLAGRVPFARQLRVFDSGSDRSPAEWQLSPAQQRTTSRR